MQAQPVAAAIAPAEETFVQRPAAVSAMPVTPEPLPMTTLESAPAVEAALAARESAEDLRNEEIRGETRVEASRSDNQTMDHAADAPASGESSSIALESMVVAETPPPAEPTKTRSTMRPSPASQGEIIQSLPLSAAIAVSLAESAYQPMARTVPTPSPASAPTAAPVTMPLAEPNPGLPANVPVATDYAPLAGMAPDDLGSATDAVTPSSIDAASRTPGLFDEVAAPANETPADTAAQIVSTQDDAATSQQPESGQAV